MSESKISSTAPDLEEDQAYSQPTQVQLLESGAVVFERMLAAVENSERRVHLEMYAFRLDSVGTRFVDALLAAAARGVRVGVILDGWGSLRFGSTIVAMLRAGGCEAQVHNRISRVLLGRMGCNHRKLLVVDHSLAFIGGVNIGEEFLAWDDLAVELRGPLCAGLVDGLHDPFGAEDRHPIRVFLSQFKAGMVLRNEYLNAIAKARSRVLIAHAYFFPDRAVLKAIEAARRVGAEVTLLLPSRSDIPLLRFGIRRLYRRLLTMGVRIYELDLTILHAKAAVVDGSLALIGSFNLDPLSLTNLEVLVRIEDEPFAEGLERWIQARIARASLITNTRTHSANKLWAWFPELLGFLVRKAIFQLAAWLAR